MRTTVRLNEDLLRRIKAYAAERNLSMTSVLEDAVRQLLDQQQRRKNQPGRRHVELITSGGDGYVDGIEHLTPAMMKEFLEQEDIEQYRPVTDADS